MGRFDFRRGFPRVVTGTSVALLGCGRSLVVDFEDSAGLATDSTTEGATATDGSDTSDSTPNPGPNPGPGPDPVPVPVPLPGPPVLIDARVLDASTIELFFSEPIATTQGVEPSKFRLSASYSRSNYGEATTSYGELGRWSGEEVCYENCYGGEGYGYTGGYDCYDWCYSRPGPDVHVNGVKNSSYIDRVLLTLDQPISLGVCDHIRERRESGAIAALFLHYSNNGPGILDYDGEPLDAIAEHWALLAQQDYAYQPGSFPYMNPFIPIDCPF